MQFDAYEDKRNRCTRFEGGITDKDIWMMRDNLTREIAAQIANEVTAEIMKRVRPAIEELFSQKED